MRSALVFVLAAVGCTAGTTPMAAPKPSSPSGTEAKAGARLRPIDLVGDDDSRFFSGKWLDTELGVSCQVGTLPGPDRTQRCLPSAMALRIVFAAPDCSLKAAVTSPSQGYIQFEGRVHEAGGDLPGAFQMVGQSCVIVELDAEERVRAIGDDVTDGLVSFREEQP